MKYTVVEHINDIEKLEKDVNKLLEDGWRLYGNLTVAASGPNQGIDEDNFHVTGICYLYAQTLIKE